MKESRALLAYMGTVVAFAAPLIGMVAFHAVDKLVATFTGELGLIVTLFCIVLIVGEMWPIPVARGEEAGDEITVSSTFGFGLLLIAPVAVVATAQAVALIIDAIVRGRPLTRLLFNIAQYGIAFIAARYVYAWVSGQAFAPPNPAPLPVLLPALAAAATFLVINNTLVAIAVSISVQQRLVNVLFDDLRWQIATSAPLLALGPLAVQAMFWTPVSLILLLMPIITLHHSGTTLMRREQEALRDPLTGLANRAMLTSATESALAKSIGRHAMLLFDLDHFKDINDTLGHGVGDEMLIAVAERLRVQAGSSNLVARLGGDEFVVLVRSVEDKASALAFAERLCAVVQEPVVLNGVTLTVGCSVGIAFGPDHADSVSDLLRCADIALYNAKVNRGHVTVYHRDGDEHSAARLGLQADLRMALENPDDEQIWVAFQPQLHLRTGRIESVECLVRWQHPELGPIEPSIFIPIAESTSLIDLLFHRVLNTSLGHLVEWDRRGLELSVCVNLSARQLSNLSLPAVVHEHLTRHGIAAKRLALEVTESRLMSDPKRSTQIVRELHALGVQMSIDDFGTGYSSLEYLQRLAVHELKIDRSFTAELSATGDPTIVRSTIELGHNLGLRVVAEGVEDIAMACRLATMGCDVLQGYVVGRPVLGSAIPTVIATPRRWVPQLGPVVDREGGVPGVPFAPATYEPTELLEAR